MGLQVATSHEPSMFMEPVGSPVHSQQTENFSGRRPISDPNFSDPPLASSTIAMPNGYSPMGPTIAPFVLPGITQPRSPRQSSQRLDFAEDASSQNVEPGSSDARRSSRADGSEFFFGNSNMDPDVEESIVNVNINNDTAPSDTTAHASSYDELHAHSVSSSLKHNQQ